MSITSYNEPSPKTLGQQLIDNLNKELKAEVDKITEEYCLKANEAIRERASEIAVKAG